MATKAKGRSTPKKNNGAEVTEFYKVVYAGFDSKILKLKKKGKGRQATTFEDLESAKKFLVKKFKEDCKTKLECFKNIKTLRFSAPASRAKA